MKKLFFLILLLNSCVVDRIHKIAVVKNLSDKNIVVVFKSADIISDETLFYGSKYTVVADSLIVINALGYHSKKINFFIFDADSVNYNIGHGKINGIVKKSFLKKINVSVENLKKNDTIIYKVN